MSIDYLKILQPSWVQLIYLNDLQNVGNKKGKMEKTYWHVRNAHSVRVNLTGASAKDKIVSRSHSTVACFFFPTVVQILI